MKKTRSLPARTARPTLAWPGRDVSVDVSAEETFYTGEAWKNKLYHGDNLAVMRQDAGLLAGRVHLVYIDPPFASGNRFTDRDDALAFDDRLDPASWLAMMEPRLRMIHVLLHDTGSIIVHCDYRTSHYLGMLLDEIFGSGDRGPTASAPGFRNEIVWSYGLGGSSPRCYPKKHDTLLWYSKGPTWIFDPPRVPASSIRMRGQLKKAPDTWDIPSINNMARERTGYPTQKPEALLERVVGAHSRPGDVVADFFCGSGTTLVVAERLGRRWIGCDLGAAAVATSHARLDALSGAAPWERVTRT